MPTKIEWCHETWNPITGCTKVSAGCANCYAERMATRMRGRFGYPADNPFRPTFHPDRIDQPRRWPKPKPGERRLVFVDSMGDLFHEDMDTAWVKAVWDTMVETPWNTYLLLTKRPQVMQFWITCTLDGAPPPANIWCGTSVENQEWADVRIPWLLRTPAAVRFVSVEPMLGPVDLQTGVYIDGPESMKGTTLIGLDWVICGGESGPGARPMHPDWPRSLRDQCAEAGVPFVFKQWGSWVPYSEACYDRDLRAACYRKRQISMASEVYMDGPVAMGRNQVSMHLVGKKHSGRTLDGKIHDEYPNTEAGE